MNILSKKYDEFEGWLVLNKESQFTKQKTETSNSNSKLNESAQNYLCAKPIKKTFRLDLGIRDSHGNGKIVFPTGKIFGNGNGRERERPNGNGNEN